MEHSYTRRGVTGAEVLVALAAVALLITCGMAAMTKARQYDSKTLCLANMREIGRASWFYANEDEREQIIPLAGVHVLDWHGAGFLNTAWGWRTGEPCAYGGRTPVKDFPMETGVSKVMRAQSEGGTGFWEAYRRPLNAYIDGGRDQADAALEVFHCPADGGYPDEEWVIDAPREAAEIPCFDFIGNSYRMNTTGLVWTGGVSGSLASFRSAPSGHSATTVPIPAETVLHTDPLFYNLVRFGYEEGWLPDASGWHGFVKADNALFVDGSARLTRIDPLREFTRAELEQMGFSRHFSYSQYHYFLRRGPGWREDVYPAPGAIIDKYGRTGRRQMSIIPYAYGWPFEGALRSLPPLF